VIAVLVVDDGDGIGSGWDLEFFGRLVVFDGKAAVDEGFVVGFGPAVGRGEDGAFSLRKPVTWISRVQSGLPGSGAA